MRTLAATLVIATCWTIAATPAAQAQNSDQKAYAKQQVLWNKLESQIREIDRNLDGVMGVAIEDLTTGRRFFFMKMKFSHRRVPSKSQCLPSFTIRRSFLRRALLAKRNSRICTRSKRRIWYRTVTSCWG